MTDQTPPNPPADTVVTYVRNDGREAMTTATNHQRDVLRAAGRLVKDHGKPDTSHRGSR